jgi:DNA-binding LacI/PurR family transcriptional regulator
VVRERLAGWRTACAAAGLAPPATVSVPFNTREYGVRAARLLLDARSRATAIVCLSDELALGVIAELAANGVGVPSDVSVVGFDDSPVAALATPPLTTVRQPARHKGATAARRLLDRLGGAEPGNPVVLATELVIRGSTAARRRRAQMRAG